MPTPWAPAPSGGSSASADPALDQAFDLVGGVRDQRLDVGPRLAPLAEAPALAQGARDLEADVVRRALVARARVAQPDDQPVGGRDPAEELHSSDSASSDGASPPSPSASPSATGSPSSPTSAVSS